MRLRLRAAGFFALAVVAITCTEAPTGPRDGRGAMSARHLSMAPSFSPAAAQVYSNLAAFGIEVTEVHIQLTAPDGTARDTTISFPAGQDTLVIDIPVDAGGTDQTYTALLELRNDAHMVLFSGTQKVIARTFSLVPETPPVVVISYTGPGTKTKTVAVSPGDLTTGASATIPVSATAIDSSGAPVTDLLVRWTTSDATLATITKNGDFTASVVAQGRRGTAIISAITPSGITGTSRFTFVPPATKVVVISGGGQTGVAGSLLPAALVVEVQASDNLPVAGVPVVFSAVTAGGVVTTATATSDALGRASTTLTLGKTGGAYQYQAASGALPAVSVSETATPAPPAAVAIASGNAQVDSVGRTLALPLVVKVTDQFGGAASGATVTWARVSGAGVVGTATSTSASDGLASTTYTLGNTVGAETISATVAGVSGTAGTTTFSATAISRGAASIALMSGGGQSGAPGVTLAAPLVVRVADVLNNPVANATVAWTTPSTGTTFTPASSLTDALGQVTTSVKLGTVAGPVVTSATTAALAATANLTIVPGPAAVIAKVAGDAQTAEVATNVPVAPSAKVTDASGNAISGAAVVFSIATGGGSVTAASTATDASGVAAVGSWKLGNVAGANSLTATAGALTTTFAATGKSGSAAKLAFVTVPPTSITVGVAVPAFTAQITDALNNAVATAGVTVTATAVVTPGGETTPFTATTDAAGLATFAVPPYVGVTGTAVLTLSAPGLSSMASAPITIGAGAPARLAIKTQPSVTAASGAILAAQPALQLTDAGGNVTTVAGVSVTAAIGSGGGTLGGTKTLATIADGTVSFTDLAISGPTGARTLAFTAPSLTGVSSSAITLGAGAAATMTKNAGDGQSATAGSTVAVPPSVVVKDAAGNPVSGAAVTFAVATGGGSATEPTATTNASGIATVGSWKLGNSAGPNTLTATSGTFSATFTATGTSGSAAKLVYVTAPAASITVGLAIPAFSVQITDALNNAVATSGVTVTATGVITPGGFTATYTATTDAAGLATFALPVYLGPLGTSVITSTAPGLTPIASSPITLIAGAAAKLAITTQPSPTAASGAALATQPVVQVRDAGNNNLSVAGVSITAVIATGGGTLIGTSAVTSTAAGLVTFTDLAISGTAGARTLSFTAAGLTTATSNAVTLGAGAAAVMTKDAGDAQTATAGSMVAIPPSVLVKDAAGNPVAGAAVTFAVASGGGGVTGPGTTTNASGIATVGSFTLGNVAGANTLTATSGTFTVTFTATGTSGSAAKLAFVAAPPASIKVGAAIPAITARITDALNNAVAAPGVTVTATGVTTPGGFTTTLATTTDATGLATFNLPSYAGPTGSAILTLGAPGLTSVASSPITVGAGAPAKLTIATQPSTTAASGAALAVQPVVQLTDVGGNNASVAGVPVIASIATGGGTLSGAQTLTSTAAGVVTFTDLAISGTAGARTLTFTSAGLTASMSNTITLGAGAAATMTKDAGDAQTATAGSAVAIPPRVLVKDAAGNPVAGAAVTFSVASGGGTVSGPTVTTDASGLGAVGSWTLGSAVGANSLTVTNGGLSAIFTATGTAGAGARFAFVTPPPATVTVGGGPSVSSVRLTDTFGNAVASAGVSVTATAKLSSGEDVGFVTGISDASGLATFTIPNYTGPVGTVIITYSATGYSPLASSPITILTGAAAALKGVTPASSTGTVDIPLAQQPAVRVVDAGGNPVAGTGVNVTVSIASGGGTLGGTTAVATDAAGVATFTDLFVSGLAGARTLAFSSTPLAGISSTPISFVAGAASKLLVVSGNGQTATAGTAVATVPTVKVTDASGNGISGVSVTVTPRNGSRANGSGTPTTLTTTAGGTLALASWQLGPGAGAKADTVDFAAAGLSGSPAIIFANATAAAAAKLTISTQPSSSGESGVALAQQPVVRVEDAFGNIVASTATVAAVIKSGTGSLASATVTAAGGIATFSGLTITGVAGPFVLDLQSTGLATATSSSINLTAGAASALSITTQPSSSAQSGVVLSQQPVLQLRDASNNAVALAAQVITASVLSGGGTLTAATATTNAAGQATFSGLTIMGSTGSRVLNFSLGAASVASNAITLAAGAPAAMTKDAGDAQTAAAGAAVAVPPSVLVKDAAGNPVAGVPVTFAVASGAGTVTAPSTTTTASGVATVGSWTLGNVAGTNTLTATSGSLNVTFTATGIAGAFAKLAYVVATPATAASGAALSPQPQLQLQDALGNSVATAGVTITATLASGTGSLAGASATTVPGGIATFAGLSISGASGNYTLSFSAGGSFAPPSPIALGAGALATIAVSPTSTSVAAADTARFTAVGRDASGNIIAITPTWAVVTPASGSIAGSGLFTAGTAVGTYSNDITATVGGVVGKASVTVTPGSIATVTVAPAVATMTVNGTQTYTAVAKDAFGNVVTFTPVWNVIAGGGTINASSGVFTAGSTAGSFANTVRASSGAVSGTASVSVVAGPLASIIVMPAAPSLTPGGVIAFTANGSDVFGNPVSVVPVWSVVAGGGAIDASSGMFTAGGTAGTYTNTIRATSGAVNGLATVTVTAGAAAKLVGASAMPTSVTVGVPITPAFIAVRVTDASGNPVSGVRDVSVTGNVSPSGTTFGATVSTDATGLATFALPTYVGPKGTLTLTVSSSGLASLASGAISVLPGAPAALSLVRAPSSTAMDRVPFGVQPQVQLVDVGGNASLNVATITAGVVSGGAVATGNSATTDAAGLATFSALAIQGPVGPQVIQFASGALTPVNSGTITLGAGAPATLAISAGNSQSATVGSAVAVPPRVIVKDASNNPVPGVAVTFGVASGGGAIVPGSGTVTTDASGLAAVTSWTLGTTTGSNSLTGTVSGIAPVTFTATATAGAAAKLAFIVTPGATASSGVALSPIVKVQVQDALNNPVGGVATGITATASLSGATLANAVATTDASGLATFTGLAVSGSVGSFTLSFTRSGLPTLTSGTITLGAGAGAALTFSTTPATTAASGVALAQQPVIQVRDASGNAVAASGILVTATIKTGTGTLSSATATTNAGGVATFTGLTITGSAGGFVLKFDATSYPTLESGSITLSAGAPAAMARDAGDGQSATAGTAVAIPPRVRVTDASGNPVPGVSITFAVATGGGSIPGPTVVTDAAGRAAVASWTLGNVAGPNTLTASVGALLATFSATGTSGVAAQLAFTVAPPASVTSGVGISPAIQVQVQDALGNPASGSGANISARLITGTGTLSGNNAVPNASGLATFPGMLVEGIAGSIRFEFSQGSLVLNSATLTLAPGAASKLAIKVAGSSTATSGSPLAVAPVIAIVDASGNSVAQSTTTITASVRTGTGTLTNFSGVTNGSGEATFTGLTIAGTAGPFSLRFASPPLAVVDGASIAVSAGSASAMSKSAGDAQTATAGSAVPVAPSVLVTDASGNPVSGVPVLFGSVTGGGSITGPNATTDASGHAAVGSWTLGNAAGTNTLTASASGLGTVTFSASGTAGAAAKFALVSTMPASVTVGAPITPSPFNVRIVDALGNPVAGIRTVTISGNVQPSNTNFSSDVSSDASGLVSFLIPPYTGPTGSLVITVSSSGLAALSSASIPVLTGAAASLAITTQPPATAASGAVFSVSPKIQVVDAGGNAVSDAGLTVTAAFATGSGTLAGFTATTNTGGVATFSAIAISGTVGARTLQFSSGSLVSPTSGTITVGAGAATAMSKSAGDGQTATVGSAVAVAPQVLVVDASGNPVAGASVTFAPSSGGSVTGTNPAATDASGHAAIGSWILSGSAGANTLSATSGGLSALFNASGTAGRGTLLSIATQPSASATNGAAFPIQPIIQLTDGSGNPVSTAGVTVTASISSGSGSLASTTAVSDGAGRATFAGLGITGAAGSFTLNFDAPSYSSVASNAISLGAGTAAKLQVKTGFSDGQSGVAFGTQPVVRVLDSGDNPVMQMGIGVSVSVATGGGTLTGTTTSSTDASGMASFTDLVVTGTAGPRTFAFSAPGLATINTAPINVTAGAAAKLSITTAPPATAQNDVAFTTQPVIQLVDASNNPVATSGMTIYAGLDVGGSLRNQAATTNASGAATFSGLAIQGIVGSYTITFSTAIEGITTAKTGVIVVSAGVPVQIAFVQQPSKTPVNVAIAPAVTLRLLDDIGNPVTAADAYTATVRISIESAVLSGTLTQPFVGGVATFNNLSLNRAFSDFDLIASTTAPGVSEVTSDLFDIITPPPPTIVTETGKAAVRPGETVPAGTIKFLVRDGFLNPMSGVTVNFSAGGSDDCTIPASTTTDGSGRVTLAVGVGGLGTGCVISATAVGVELSATAQVVSVPLVATYAWIGGAADGPVDFERAENWLFMPTRAAQVPASTDAVYVPLWTTYEFPTLSVDRSLGSLFMQSGSLFDLATHVLTTSGDISAGNAFLTNGTVVSRGSDVNVTGFFDTLVEGKAGSCSTSAPEFSNFRTAYSNNSVTVACGIKIGYAQGTDFVSLPGSFVTVTPGGSMSFSNSATFGGDSLVVGDNAVVGVGGIGKFDGSLALGVNSAIYTSGAEFTGSGNISAGQISVDGDVLFSGSRSSGYLFTGGQLYLYGNFSQKGTGAAYNATANHTLWTLGNYEQKFQLETPVSNVFGTMNVQNAGGVLLQSDLNFRASDYAPTLQVSFSQFTVPVGVTLTLPGYLNFYSGGSMTVNGAATYWGCYSDGITSPVSGSGTANGAPASDGGGCSYGSSGGASASLRPGQSTSAAARPTRRKLALRPVPAPPVIRRRAPK